MKLGMYAIRDVKTCFMTPTLDQTKEAAIRNFTVAIRQGTSLLHAMPQDFDLFYVGEFDAESGIISALSVPEFVVAGAAVAGGSEDKDDS